MGHKRSKKAEPKPYLPNPKVKTVYYIFVALCPALLITSVFWKTASTVLGVAAVVPFLLIIILGPFVHRCPYCGHHLRHRLFLFRCPYCKKPLDQ